MNQTALGQRIAAHRRQKNMTQEALAEALGVSVSTVRGWEGDATRPDSQLMSRLSQLLDIAADAPHSGNPTAGTRLARKAIYESDWVCLYLDTVHMPDGTVIDGYHQLHYPHESVSVVIMNQHGDILLIRNRRYTTGRLEWEVPAGRIETGESPENAARRECLEETGCTLRELKYLCWQNPCNGMSDLKIHVFAAHVDAESAVRDANEVESKQWFSPDQVRHMLQRGDIHCGVSMLALLRALTFST